MNNIMLSVAAVLTAAAQTESKPGVNNICTPGDQPEIKPVENDEVFDHLFLCKYGSLTILRKTAA